MATPPADTPAQRKPKKVSATQTRARGPGRPSGSLNGPEQRKRLLDTAMQLFARQGIAETPLSAIAREAGVTPAMLHYYFKSREQLLDVLIDERIQPRRLEIGKTFNPDAGDPVTVITQLVERLMRTSEEHAWFPALWMREVFSDNGVLRQRIQQRYGSLHHQAVIDCIAQWQAQGRLNPDFEPSLLFITIFGLTILPMIATKAWQNDPLRAKLGPADIARHAVAILSHGVSPTS
jgi:TetR/AcrR family transcriptional regulator